MESQSSNRLRERQANRTVLMAPSILQASPAPSSTISKLYQPAATVRLVDDADTPHSLANHGSLDSATTEQWPRSSLDLGRPKSCCGFCAAAHASAAHQSSILSCHGSPNPRTGRRTAMRKRALIPAAVVALLTILLSWRVGVVRGIA